MFGLTKSGISLCFNVVGSQIKFTIAILGKKGHLVMALVGAIGAPLGPCSK